MKINTTWTQADWNKALKKVWELSRNFDEILEFGLENNFITSSDIIQASDMYKDPNKTYDETEIEDFVKSVPLSDLMKTIKDTYGVYDIIESLHKSEVLSEFNKDDLLDELYGSWELEAHDDDIRADYYQEIYDDMCQEMNEKLNEKKNELSELNPDNLHKHICDIANCGYYNQNAIDDLKERLNKNSYNIKY